MRSRSRWPDKLGIISTCMPCRAHPPAIFNRSRFEYKGLTPSDTNEHETRFRSFTLPGAYARYPPVPPLCQQTGVAEGAQTWGCQTMSGLPDVAPRRAFRAARQGSCHPTGMAISMIKFSSKTNARRRFTPLRSQV